MGEITTVGSANIDLIAYAERRPRSGETLPGRQFRISPGGKGLNQAVQVARCGCRSYLVARLGADSFGTTIREHLTRSHVESSLVVNDAAGTGIGHVLVEPDGQYTAVIVANANANLCPEDVDGAAPRFRHGSGLLLQLEVPVETDIYAAAKARKSGAQVFLNAAPARKLPEELLQNIDVLIVNEIEAEMICGIAILNTEKDGLNALKALNEMCPNIVVSLGERGCVAMNAQKEAFYVPGHSVFVRNTIGAGDSFVGALSARTVSGDNFFEAVQYANAAAAAWVSGETSPSPSGSSIATAVSASRRNPIPLRLASDAPRSTSSRNYHAASTGGDKKE